MLKAGHSEIVVQAEQKRPLYKNKSQFIKLKFFFQSQRFVTPVRKIYYCLTEVEQTSRKRNNTMMLINFRVSNEQCIG